MGEKNRFSKLLQHLMSIAELKNSTLAQELQYDVSYISKWINGRIIPSEKTEKTILEGISRCIVDTASQKGLEILLSDYQVENKEELQLAIFDNLEAEYFYVRELQKNTGTTTTAKTAYFPELTLPQYISKMRHPVLRRVKSLNIVAIMDLMAMGREHRFQLTRFESEHIPWERGYPDVHYSLVINIQPDKWDYIYDTIFLINLLSTNTSIDFKLYGNENASGKMIFAVKDDYTISGMLAGQSHCMSVVVSENEKNCNTLYQNIKVFCSQEQLLFHKTTIKELALKHEYIYSLLSLNQRWLIGHFTEHFLPDDLFEEIINELDSSGKLMIDQDELRKFHHLTKNIINHSPIKLMIYESVFSNLIGNKKLDFYNHDVILNPKQLLRYMEHFLALYQRVDTLEIKLIYGQFISNFEYSTNQCIFLTESISFLRLGSHNPKKNLLLLNRSDIRKIFDRSFQECWNNYNNMVISEKTAIIDYMQHVIKGIRIASQEVIDHLQFDSESH